jgi:hypothetical protein
MEESAVGISFASCTNLPIINNLEIAKLKYANELRENIILLQGNH